MSLEFTNTCDMPLLGSDLNKFLEEVRWNFNGSPIVFRDDGNVDYMGRVYPYDFEDRGNCDLSPIPFKYKTENDDGTITITHTRLEVWIGTYITFQLPNDDRMMRYYPVVENGKYYLFNSTMNAMRWKMSIIAAKGFTPPPTGGAPTCSICFEEPADYVAVPCGHKCGCCKCFHNVMERNCVCPICRKVIDRVIRVYETDKNYVTSEVGKNVEMYNVNDLTQFPPLPRPVFEVNNIDSSYSVIEGGHRNKYNWSEFLNKFDNNSKNIVMWNLLNGDEQHGKVCDIYNLVYMCAMAKFPVFFGFKFPTNNRVLRATFLVVVTDAEFQLIRDRQLKPGQQIPTEKPSQAPVEKTKKVLKPSQLLAEKRKVLSAHAQTWTPGAYGGLPPPEG